MRYQVNNCIFQVHATIILFFPFSPLFFHSLAWYITDMEIKFQL